MARRSKLMLIVGAVTGITLSVAAVCIVVLVIVGISANKKYQSAKKVQQLAAMQLDFHDSHLKYAPEPNLSELPAPILSWRTQMVIFLDRPTSALHDKFHWVESWDSDHNRTLIDPMPEAFLATGDSITDNKSAFLIPVGPGTVFENGKGTRYHDISDGMAYTIIIVEADAEQATIWTKPDEYEVDMANPKKSLGKRQGRGFFVSMADGSIHFIPNHVDDSVMRALFTKNAKDQTPLPANTEKSKRLWMSGVERAAAARKAAKQ
jgi:hypothetical protein